MNRPLQILIIAVIALNATVVAAERSLAVEPLHASIEFKAGDGRVTVMAGGRPIADYVYRDDAIPRPYFAHVRARSGIQVTRHHPPIEGQDLMDHGTFHPGIWMSFGDISGSDYWRAKARVRHVEFVTPPSGGAGSGTFEVRNQYLDQKNPSTIVCDEVARYSVLDRPAGILLLWDSTFSSDREFAFGDQEEMGLGFRMATPLRVGASGKEKLPPGNGTILDSEGRKNEQEVWGNSAKWCDYSGTMADQHVGMTIFCHPENFRPSWFHARNQGLLEANPFGRQAFHQGEKSLVVVRPGENLRLRYGILIHSDPQDHRPNLAASYEDYLQQAGIERQ